MSVLFPLLIHVAAPQGVLGCELSTFNSSLQRLEGRYVDWKVLDFRTLCSCPEFRLQVFFEQFSTKGPPFFCETFRAELTSSIRKIVWADGLFSDEEALAITEINDWLGLTFRRCDWQLIQRKI